MTGVVSSRAGKDKQYFIAIIPPPPIFDQALAEKQYFKEHYNSKASLNSPPHITLHMPFKWNEEKEINLTKQLHSFMALQQPATVRLDNFSSFPPRVIFINVLINEGLIKLQQDLRRYCKLELNLFNANYKEQPFHPHLTVAFRDLKKSNYERAWDEFSKKTFAAEFVANNISLLKHNGKVWEVHHVFNLADPK